MTAVLLKPGRSPPCSTPSSTSFSLPRRPQSKAEQNARCLFVCFDCLFHSFFEEKPPRPAFVPSFLPSFLLFFFSFLRFLPSSFFFSLLSFHHLLSSFFHFFHRKSCAFPNRSTEKKKGRTNFQSQASSAPHPLQTTGPIRTKPDCTSTTLSSSFLPFQQQK